MKYEDLTFGKKTTLELQYTDNTAQLPRPGAPVTLRPGDGDDDPIIKTSHGELSVTPIDDRNSTLIDKIFESGCYRLCRVLAAPKDRLVIAVHEFPDELFMADTVSIGVDENAIDAARKKGKSYTAVEEVVAWLNDELVLSQQDSDDRYIFLTGTPGNRSDLASAFRLLGRTVSVDVKTDAKGRLHVERVVYAQKNASARDAQSVRLVRGSIQFVDGTIAQEFRGLAKELIDQVVKGGESYLALWQRYNEIEREIGMRKAREFGVFQYDACQSLADGSYEFTFNDASEIDAIRTADESRDACLEAASAPPADFLSIPEEAPKEQGNRSQRTFTGSIQKHRGKKIILQTDDEDPVEPPQKGFLYLSIRGDTARLNRRESAHKRIIDGKCPMPQLGLILEGRHTPERRPKKEKALSTAAKKAFRGTPTPRQIEALETALTAPDIVLIQGPPGTGKTRVIAALQSRLAELHDDKSLVAGRILLTSYQHDAVENVAEATEIFGLPAIKIGRKRDQSARTDGIIRWLEERKESVDGQLSVVHKKSISPIIDKVNRWESGYRNSPNSYENLIPILNDLEELTSEYLQASTQDQMQALKAAIVSHTRNPNALPEKFELALKAVRSLRTDAISFGDDGPDQAFKAARRLKNVGGVNEQEIDLLHKLSELELNESPDASDLAELKQLQENWIDRLLSHENTQQKKSGLNTEIVALFQSIKTDLRERLALDPDEGVDAALHEYRVDLNDENTMRHTIEHYSTSLAATCQQAVGNKMIELKGDSESWPTFEYVIVDEAARANPLDLLIPMSLAERKIVLVGDHRQLPHILETEIENEMDAAMEGSSLREKTNEVLRESLFERLYKLMQAREVKDGIARTVTLDEQFRMHPRLGKFVSDTFYEPYGEGFKSGRTEEDMAHAIEPYCEAQAPAVWMNIPGNKGRELTGMSKARPVEAKWVANEALRIMNAHPNLSVGVITFYRKQVDLVHEELEKNGAVERDENGEFVINSSYRQTRDAESDTLKERLRVGTVDAFQGKEFDVVLLSMVRSNESPITEDTKSLRRKFGHLMLENRLCVGMSRQQRLLIVCGDVEMLNGKSAQDAIPGLLAFYELCKNQGKVVHV